MTGNSPWDHLTVQLRRLSARVDKMPNVREATMVSDNAVRFDIDSHDTMIHGSLVANVEPGSRVLTLTLKHYIWVLGVREGGSGGGGGGGSTLSNAIYVRSYLTPGATPLENSAAISTAVGAATSAGKSVCFDGVHVSVADEVQLPANTLAWSTRASSTTLTQTNVLGGKGIFRVVGDNVTIQGFTLTGATAGAGFGVIDLTGMTADVHEASAIKVQPGVKNLRVSNIKGDGWFIVLAGFPYPIGFENSSDPNNWQRIEGLRVSDIEVSRVWGAVRMSGLKNADFSDVRGSYVVAGGPSQASGAPPHLFYISMPTEGGAVDVPKADASGPFYNLDVRVRDCHAVDSVGGAAYSLRYTKGMTLNNLTSHGCEGNIDMIGVKSFTVGPGCNSTDDIYPKDNLWNGNRGSMSWLYCTDGVIQPFVVESRASFDHGRLLFVGVCTNVTVVRPTGWLHLATADGGLAASYLSGHNVHIVQPDFESRGASVAFVNMITGGFNSDSSTVHLDDPRGRGNFLYDLQEWKRTNTRSRITYHPDRLVNNKFMIASDMPDAAWPVLDNLKFGYPPAVDPTIVGWIHGQVLSSTTSLRDRWSSGQKATIATDAWISPNPPEINSNATITGLWCVDLGSQNIELEAEVRHGSGSMGFAFRATDTSNFLQVVMTPTQIVLAKRDAGVTTDLGPRYTIPEPGSNIRHHMRLRAVGTRLTVWFDGQLAMTYLLAGADATKYVATNHGLRSDNAGANSSWKRFLARRV